MQSPSHLPAAAVDLLLAVWLGSATFSKGAPPGLKWEAINQSERAGTAGVQYDGAEAEAAIKGLLQEQEEAVMRRHQQQPAAVTQSLDPALLLGSSAAAAGDAARGAPRLLLADQGMGGTPMVPPHQPLECLPRGAGEPFVRSAAASSVPCQATRLVTLLACCQHA